jgi:hypothetical protein
MDISNALIQRGNIFHSCEFEGIDHCKYFVVIGEDEKKYIGFFFINSNISQNIKKKPDFFEMQMPIKKSVYPSFLKYDSFIDCHEILQIPKNKLAEQIRNKLTEYRDSLTKEDEEILLNGLRNSNLYSEIEKDIYFS